MERQIEERTLRIQISEIIRPPHNKCINTICYTRHCRFVFGFGVYGRKIQFNLHSSKRVMQAL